MEAGQLLRALMTAFREGTLNGSDLLVKNAVGNLAIVRKDVYVGFIDLRYADIIIFEDEVADQEQS